MKKSGTVLVACALGLAVILSCIIAVLLHNKSKQVEANQLELTRWDSGFRESGLKVEYSDTYGESFERHYTGTIECDVSRSVVKDVVPAGQVESQEELEEKATPVLEKVKAQLDATGEFQASTISSYDGLVQLAAVSEPRRNQFSVNYRVDGSVQAIYYTTWQSSGEIPTASNIVDGWNTYTGVTLGEADLLRSYNVITEVANFGGTYKVFVNDDTSYTYFALVVHDYGTSAEYWECYISVAGKFNEE